MSKKLTLTSQSYHVQCSRSPPGEVSSGGHNGHTAVLYKNF